MEVYSSTPAKCLDREVCPPPSMELTPWMSILQGQLHYPVNFIQTKHGLPLLTLRGTPGRCMAGKHNLKFHLDDPVFPLRLLSSLYIVLIVCKEYRNNPFDISAVSTMVSTIRPSLLE